MKNATNKPARTITNEYSIAAGVVTLKEKASGKAIASWDMNALPDPIKLQILGQGGSTILQQRKSGKNGQEALDIMNAHYANWMNGSWEMERSEVKNIPAWVFPALCLKLPGVDALKIDASLKAKRAASDAAAWDKFLAELAPYKAQLGQQGQQSPDDLLDL